MVPPVNSNGIGRALPVNQTNLFNPWKPMKFPIVHTMKDGSEYTEEVQGQTFGNLSLYQRAATKDGVTDQYWRLGVLCNGCSYCVTWMETEADAKLVAAILWDECCMILRSFKTQLEMKAAMPHWVRPWALAMRECNKIIDHKPFMQASEGNYPRGY